MVLDISQKICPTFYICSKHQKDNTVNWVFLPRYARSIYSFLSYFSYHLGTAALGSLVIPISYIFRAILGFIYGMLRKWDNKLTKCTLSCMKCLFWSTKKTYIMCAIHGKPFCTSARDAFNLLMRTFPRAVALNKITEFLFVLVKITMSIGMGAVAYIFIEDKSLYAVVSVVIVIIGTYIIASIFFGVFSMAVDTLFLCFRMYSFRLYWCFCCCCFLFESFNIPNCTFLFLNLVEDCERNDGSEEKPYFMSSQLMKMFGRWNIRIDENRKHENRSHILTQNFWGILLLLRFSFKSKKVLPHPFALQGSLWKTVGRMKWRDHKQNLK